MAEQNVPDPLDPVEQRKRQIRRDITVQTGAIIDYKAARQWGNAEAAAELVAKLRRELAELSRADTLGEPGTVAGP